MLMWLQVHLVSEHVWCEDYLVRSLYLKNSQTGETRTVTQFHFLSWPDGNIPTSTKAILEFRRSVPSLSPISRLIHVVVAVVVLCGQSNSVYIQPRQSMNQILSQVNLLIDFFEK